MEIFFDNFWWMIPNLALASLGFVFGLLYLHSKVLYLRVPFFILWLLFFPNTIYVLTDFEHLLAQYPKVSFIEGLLLIIQYGVLIIIGLLTYFVGMMPIEAFFKKLKKKKQNNYDYVFVLLNMAVGFGVVLGKVERTHSWYVFTQPMRVFDDIVSLLTNPVLVGASITLGILFNIIYFSFKKRFAKLK